MNNLQEAIMFVVEGIEEDAKDIDDSRLARQILGYARNLRIAVKAAGDNPVQPVQQHVIPPEIQNILEIQKAREEIKKQKGEAVKEENLGQSMVVLADGPAAGDMMEISAVMPVGARMMIGDAAYELRADRKLYLHKADTDKVRGIIVEGQ